MSQNSNQTLEFFCPKCNQRLRAASRLAGQRLVCPQCQQNVKVPSLSNLGSSDSESAQSPRSKPQNEDAQWLDLDAPTPAPSPAPAGNPSQSPLRSSSPKATPPIPADDDDLPLLAPADTASAANVFASDLFASIRLDEPSAASTDPASTKPSSAKPSSARPNSARPNSTNPAKPHKNSLGNASLEAQSENHNAEYRITCRTCGTPQYVPLRKQGKSIRCPDCHSEFTVPPPPPNWNPKAKTSKPGAKQVAHEVQLEPDTGTVAETPELHRLSAREYLSKAEQESIDDHLDNVYTANDFDSQEFMRRNFLIFSDLAVWGHAIPLGLANGTLMAALVALAAGLHSKVPAIAIDLLGMLLALVLLSLIFLCGYALVDAGAHRRSKSRNWPLGSLKTILSDGLPVLAASFLSAAPGLLLGGMAIAMGVTTVVSMIPMFLSFWALFPITILSMLNNESVSTPFSNKVLASFGPGREEWGATYFKTGIVFFIAFLMLSVGLTHFVLAVLTGIALPLSMFYAYYQTGLLGSNIATWLDVDIGQAEHEESADELPH